MLDVLFELKYWNKHLCWTGRAIARNAYARKACVSIFESVLLLKFIVIIIIAANL